MSTEDGEFGTIEQHCLVDETGHVDGGHPDQARRAALARWDADPADVADQQRAVLLPDDPTDDGIVATNLAVSAPGVAVLRVPGEVDLATAPPCGRQCTRRWRQPPEVSCSTSAA